MTERDDQIIALTVSALVANAKCDLMMGVLERLTESLATQGLSIPTFASLAESTLNNAAELQDTAMEIAALSLPKDDRYEDSGNANMDAAVTNIRIRQYLYRKLGEEIRANHRENLASG